MLRNSKAIVLPLIIIVIALLLSACPTELETTSDEPGSFTLNLSTPRSSRDILFNGTDVVVVRYDLYFDGPGEEDFEVLDHTGSSYTKENAAAGDWLIGIFGENSAGTDVSSSADVVFSLGVGETKTINVECETYPVRGVYTLAGSATGTAGSADGTGSAASFNAPRGICTNSTGTIYVADTGNNKIRAITDRGVVSTLAGSGAAGQANGTGAAASFNFPVGITADASGNLFVSEWGNDSIRKITPAGVVTNFIAGGSNSDLNNPSGLAFDASGNLFVADTGSHSIKKITPAGIITTFAGNVNLAGGWFDSATATDARFDSPQGLAIDSTTGTLYVGDTGNHRLRKITSAGEVTTLIGDTSSYNPGFEEGNSTSGKMNGPRGVAYFGNIHIADTNNHAIRAYYGYNKSLGTHAGKDPDNAPLGFAASGFANGNFPDARLNAPEGVCIYLDFSYVADTGNNAIRKIVN